MRAAKAMSATTALVARGFTRWGAFVGPSAAWFRRYRTILWLAYGVTWLITIRFAQAGNVHAYRQVTPLELVGIHAAAVASQFWVIGSRSSSLKWIALSATPFAAATAILYSVAPIPSRTTLAFLMAAMTLVTGAALRGARWSLRPAALRVATLSFVLSLSAYASCYVDSMSHPGILYFGLGPRTYLPIVGWLHTYVMTSLLLALSVQTRKTATLRPPATHTPIVGSACINTAARLFVAAPALAYLAWTVTTGVARWSFITKWATTTYDSYALASHIATAVAERAGPDRSVAWVHFAEFHGPLVLKGDGSCSGITDAGVASRQYICKVKLSATRNGEVVDSYEFNGAPFDPEERKQAFEARTRVAAEEDHIEETGDMIRVFDRVEDAESKNVRVPFLDLSVPAVQARWLTVLVILFISITMNNRLRLALGDPKSTKRTPWIMLDAVTPFERLSSEGILILVASVPLVSLVAAFYLPPAWLDDVVPAHPFVSRLPRLLCFIAAALMSVRTVQLICAHRILRSRTRRMVKPRTAAS